MSARGQQGFTLIEVMIAMVLMVIIFGATMTTWDMFQSRAAENMDRAEAMAQARQRVDSMSRDMRNLASPTPDAPNAVEKATATDIVFLSVDPNGPNAGTNVSNTRRIRFCLDDADPQHAVLRSMTQTWTTVTPPTAPPTTQCTVVGQWSNGKVVAQNIVNTAQTPAVPVFTFDNAASVRRIGITLMIDENPTGGPRPQRLDSAVYLRNQNLAPVATFTAQRVAGRRILLDASASSDPENESLEYVWFDNGIKIDDVTGPTGVHEAPGTGASTRTIGLEVYDPGKLKGTAPTQQVTVP
jgi:prepilin-type N-terminal cleavage/methylation domain-containing protein